MMPNCPLHGVYYPDYPGCPECDRGEPNLLEKRLRALEEAVRELQETQKAGHPEG